MKQLPFTVLMFAVLSYAGGITLLDDTMEISVGQYRYISFRVQPTQLDLTVISGRVEIVPDTIPLEVMLFHVDDFVRWRSLDLNVDTLFYQRTRSGDLSIPVLSFGHYYLVLSNRGNLVPVTVAATFDLLFEGSGIEYDPLGMALKMAVFLMALTAIVILIVRIAGAWKKKK
jgi:hypothetical protein